MTYENRLKDGKRLYDRGNKTHPYAVEYLATLPAPSEELSPQKEASLKPKRGKHGSR